MEKLKVGDLFIVYSSELKYSDLSINGSFLLGNINDLNDYQFPLVTFMCKYLDDNICEEYYSGLKMQINYPITDGDYFVSIYDKHNHDKRLNDVDKWKNFKKLDEYVLKYPLIIEPIHINNIRNYVVCDNNSKENTINTINKLNEMATREYLKSKKECIEQAYNEAYFDDMVTSFQKRKIK